jgi:hypothetical protein
VFLVTEKFIKYLIINIKLTSFRPLTQNLTHINTGCLWISLQRDLKTGANCHGVFAQMA